MARPGRSTAIGGNDHFGPDDLRCLHDLPPVHGRDGRQHHDARTGAVAHRGATRRRARVPLLLDRRDHRSRGVRHAGCRRPGGTRPRPGHRRAGPPAAHAAAGGHGGRHPAGPAPGAPGHARRRHLVAGGDRVAGTARPTATGRWPRCASTSTLVRQCLSRREGRLRRRLLLGSRASGSASGWASEGPRSSSAPSTRRCCAWPARWPTACCSTTCPPRTSPGRSSRFAPVRPRGASTAELTIYAYVHAGVCDRADGVERGPRGPLLLRRGRLLRRQLRAGRLRRRGRRGPRARTRPATARPRWPRCPIGWSTRIDVVGDATTVRRGHAGLRRRRGRRARAHAAAVGSRPRRLVADTMRAVIDA